MLPFMTDTGHAGAGLGAVMMAYGGGAALSPALAGVVAQAFGFPAAFVALGAVAVLGLAIWILGLRAQAGEAHGESWHAPASYQANR